MLEEFWMAKGAVILCIGVLLDAMVGDRRSYGGIAHPVVWMGKYIHILDRFLNRARKRYHVAKVGEFVATDLQASETILLDRIMGFLAVLAMVLVAGLFGGAFHAGLQLLDAPWSWLIEALLLSVLLAARSLYDHVLAVAKACASGSLDAMQAALQHIVSRDAKKLDQYGVARGAFDSLCDNYIDGVLAPLFWWAVAGLPGLFIYKMINTADSMIGYHAHPYKDFGYASAKADDLLNQIPAILGCLVVWWSALGVPSASFHGARQALLAREWRHHRSPSAGFPEAAFAGALGLSLGGKRVYPGDIVVECWIGKGRREVVADDIYKGLLLYKWACVLHLMFLFLLWCGVELFWQNSGIWTI